MLRPFWALLANHHVDLVLVGHFHDYERFADMNAAGAAVPDGTGTREIVVGTGGEKHAVFEQDGAGVVAGRQTGLFGILDLTLSAGSYSWSYVPAPPATFTDSGTETCH